MKQLTSVTYKDGTHIDLTKKPKWASHLESVGIKVDPMAWAKVKNIGQRPCDSVAWELSEQKTGDYTARMWWRKA